MEKEQGGVDPVILLPYVITKFLGGSYLIHVCIDVIRFLGALWCGLVAAKTAREIHVRVSNNRFLSVRYLVFNEWPNARI